MLASPRIEMGLGVINSAAVSAHRTNRRDGVSCVEVISHTPGEKKAGSSSAGQFIGNVAQARDLSQVSCLHQHPAAGAQVLQTQRSPLRAEKTARNLHYCVRRNSRGSEEGWSR